jgi:hypothetical protein
MIYSDECSLLDCKDPRIIAGLLIIFQYIKKIWLKNS